MRFFCFLILLPLCGAIDILPSDLPIKIPDIPIPDDLDSLTPVKILELFQQFVKDFGKEYSDIAAQEKALAAFGQSLKDIVLLNIAGKADEVTYGINEYSDLTDKEFSEQILMSEPIRIPAPIDNQTTSTSTRAKRAIPLSFDWRNKKNVVSSVRTQGGCGCCWAFSTAAMVTGAVGIKTGKLVEPSEQQICDCATKKGWAGCRGGHPGNGLQYARDTGVSPEGGYPAYTPQRSWKADVCVDKGKANNIRLKNFYEINPSDANAIRNNLITKGPIGVALAVGASLRHYKSGVFNNNDCTKKETFTGWHAVTIIGFGVEKNVPYWIIKNSWGPSFGDKGIGKYISGKDLCQLETAIVNYAVA